MISKIPRALAVADELTRDSSEQRVDNFLNLPTPFHQAHNSEESGLEVGLIYNSWLCEAQSLISCPHRGCKTCPRLRVPQPPPCLYPPNTAPTLALMIPALVFSSVFVFIPGGSLLSCKLNHAFKRTFVIF